jgi:hypothetical protein
VRTIDAFGPARTAGRLLAMTLPVLAAFALLAAIAPASVSAAQKQPAALRPAPVTKQQFLAQRVLKLASPLAVVPADTGNGTISGHVSDGSAGVEGVGVWAYDPTGGIGGQAYTDSDGDYTLSVDDGMLPNSYLVQFDPTGNAGNPYVMQWYSGGISGAASPDLATPVAVTAENDTPHIDATLVTGGRAVAGQAHDSDGHPADSPWVDLYQPFNGGWLDSLSVQADSNGYYAFPHLPDGTYRVGCQGDGAEWYNPGVPEVDLGTDTVLSADPTEIVDVVSADYASVGFTATKTGTPAAPLADAFVHAYFNTPNNGWQLVASYECGPTDPTGYTQTYAILPGDYKFMYSSPGHNDVYYKGAATLDLAAAQTVGPAPVDGNSLELTQAMTDNGGEKTAPVTTIVGAPTDWVSTDPSMSFTATDGLTGSGVYQTRWAWEGQFTWPGGDVFGGGDAWDDNPVVYDAVPPGEAAVSGIWYWSIDKNGNAETPREQVLKVDKERPTTTDDHLATYSGSATIHLTPSDGSGSGIAGTFYQLDAGPVTSGTVVTTSSVNPAHTVDYWSVDKVGNEQSPRTHIQFAVTAAPADTPMPVWRFYNFRTGTHFYTADPAEMANVRDHMKSTYSLDGVAYNVNTANLSNNTPLYRFYNLKTGTHFYTADAAEMNRVKTTMASTYHLDGVAYYVCATNVTSATTVWRFYNMKTGTHFYTADPAEKANVLNTMRSTYSLDGAGFYLAP